MARTGRHFRFLIKFIFVWGLEEERILRRKLDTRDELLPLFLDVASGIKKHEEVLCILRNVRPCCTQLGDIQDITQQVQSEFYLFQIFGCS